ncbi:hypothetical protein DIPPA_34771 [Diplonema papillatum]|nr:hypothetical protein DIPPA_09536 [Diplonema papillatum]KAJ9457793.1 hypothetical protein DIPPA_34771 [Diplonema papillatum]
MPRPLHIGPNRLVKVAKAVDGAGFGSAGVLGIHRRTAAPGGELQGSRHVKYVKYAAPLQKAAAENDRRAARLAESDASLSRKLDGIAIASPPGGRRRGPSETTDEVREGIQKLLNVFHSLRTEPALGYRCYEVVMMKLSRFGKSAEVAELMEAAAKDGVRPTPHMTAFLIDALTNEGKPAQAVEAFNAYEKTAKRNSHPVRARVLAAVLKARAKLCDESGILVTLRALGASQLLTSHHFATALSGCRSYEAAGDLFELLQYNSVPLTAPLVNAVLNVFAEAGDSKAARLILAELVSKHSQQQREERSGMNAVGKEPAPAPENTPTGFAAEEIEEEREGCVEEEGSAHSSPPERRATEEPPAKGPETTSDPCGGTDRLSGEDRRSYGAHGMQVPLREPTRIIEVKSGVPPSFFELPDTSRPPRRTPPPQLRHPLIGRKEELLTQAAFATVLKACKHDRSGPAYARAIRKQMAALRLPAVPHVYAALLSVVYHALLRNRDEATEDTQSSKPEPSQPVLGTNGLVEMAQGVFVEATAAKQPSAVRDSPRIWGKMAEILAIGKGEGALDAHVKLWNSEGPRVTKGSLLVIRAAYKSINSGKERDVKLLMDRRDRYYEAQNEKRGAVRALAPHTLTTAVVRPAKAADNLKHETEDPAPAELQSVGAVAPKRRDLVLSERDTTVVIFGLSAAITEIELLSFLRAFGPPVRLTVMHPGGGCLARVYVDFATLEARNSLLSRHKTWGLRHRSMTILSARTPNRAVMNERQVYLLSLDPASRRGKLELSRTLTLAESEFRPEATRPQPLYYSSIPRSVQR